MLNKAGLPFQLIVAALLANSVIDEKLDAFVRRYRRGLVNSLLEYLILSYLESETLCGYDIISILHDRFHVLLSPGQVYPVINYLVTHNLVSKQKDRRRVSLQLTSAGNSLLKAWRQELGSIQVQLNNRTIIAEY